MHGYLPLKICTYLYRACCYKLKQVYQTSKQQSKMIDLSTTHEYRCRINLNLYSSPLCQGLATQAAAHRHLRLESLTPTVSAVDAVEIQAIPVRLCEDDYPAWLNLKDIEQLELTTDVYRSIPVDRAVIAAKIPAIIAFAESAMQVPNHYLWGGTVAPDYDCSGLMQAAFQSQGIWLPRDSYQQEAFTRHIAIDELLPGDLIFFGTPEKTDHVALHLGELRYIHSSGIQMGRNGIGIDLLSDLTEDSVSCGYFAKLRCCGRVMNSYANNR
jgi:cell wall-associated NlpC family hydrolase